MAMKSFEYLFSGTKSSVKRGVLYCKRRGMSLGTAPLLIPLYTVMPTWFKAGRMVCLTNVGGLPKVPPVGWACVAGPNAANVNCPESTAKSQLPRVDCPTLWQPATLLSWMLVRPLPTVILFSALRYADAEKVAFVNGLSYTSRAMGKS